jgi:hypothetical protein
MPCPQEPKLSQMNPVHNLTCCLFNGYLYHLFYMMTCQTSNWNSVSRNAVLEPFQEAFEYYFKIIFQNSKRTVTLQEQVPSLLTYNVLSLSITAADSGSWFRVLTLWTVKRCNNWPTQSKAGNFSLHYRVQNGSGAHPASYPMGNRCSFPGGKAAWAWSWPLTSI